jgi:hypothetical protein
MSTRSFVLSIAVLCAAPGVAAAQAHTEPPPDPRVGLFGGFGLHAGNMSCEGDNCPSFRKGGGFDGHIGWAFTPKIALIGDLYFLGSTEDNLTITQTFATIGVRAWLVPIIWVQGGLGNAHATFNYDAGIFGNIESRTDDVPGLVVAAGLELLRSPRFSLDLELRLGLGFYGDEGDEQDTTGRNTSLGVGFTWF